MSISFSTCATRVNGTPEDKEKLPQIISAHKQWLEDHTKGRQACLREMNLEQVLPYIPAELPKPGFWKSGIRTTNLAKKLSAALRKRSYTERAKRFIPRKRLTTSCWPTAAESISS